MKKQSRILALAVLALIGFSCDDNSMGPDMNDPNAVKGTMSISVTDAPIDADNVSAVFVTFTEINVDGQAYPGFQGPKTVNLLALQNGNSLNLGTAEVAAGSYSKLDLVISSVVDDTGNNPGCYIVKTDGTKEELQLSGNGTTEINLKPKDFMVSENGTTEIIMDFDLRKAIKSQGNGKSTFVSKGQLVSAVRAENKAKTGAIVGKVSNSAAANGDVVVYAYKKGTFNENSEVNGNSDVKYPNAVTSAKVDANGNFTLAYLPAGEYEVHCDKPENNGMGIGLNTLIDLESAVDLQSVGVAAGAQTNIDLKLKLGGILGSL